MPLPGFGELFLIGIAILLSLAWHRIPAMGDTLGGLLDRISGRMADADDN